MAKLISLLISIFIYQSVAAIEQSALIGSALGDSQHFTVSDADGIMVQHGTAIDALGIITNGLIEKSGGNGGSQKQVPYQDLQEIIVYTGDFWWGGKHIIRLDFKYTNGDTISTGSTKYSNNIKSTTIPITGQLSGITAWSRGWLLDGVQFHMSNTTTANNYMPTPGAFSVDQKYFSRLDIKTAPHNEENFLYSVLTLKNGDKYIGLLSYDGLSTLNLPNSQIIQDDINWSQLKIIACMPNDIFIEQEGYVLNNYLCADTYENIAKNAEAKWFRGHELGANTYYSHTLNGDIQCLSYNSKDCVWVNDLDSDIKIINDDSTLRGLENNANALKQHLDAHDELRLITRNGAWTGNIHLPTESSNGKVVTLEVNSDWDVKLHFGSKSIRVSKGKIYSMTYVNGHWINVLNNINLDRDLVLNAKPLVCGDQHKNVWGSTGYDSPSHWCSRLRNADQALHAQNVEQMRIYKERHMDRVFDQMEAWKKHKIDIDNDYPNRLDDFDRRLDSKQRIKDKLFCDFVSSLSIQAVACDAITDEYNELLNAKNALLAERNAKIDAAEALVNEGRAKEYHKLHEEWAGDSSDFTALLKEESKAIADLKKIKEHYDKTAEEKHQEYLEAVRQYMKHTSFGNILLHAVEDLPLVGPEVKHIADYAQDPSAKNLRRMLLGVAGPVGETTEGVIELVEDPNLGLDSHTLKFLKDMLTDIGQDHSFGRMLEDVVADAVNDLGDEAIESIRQAGLWTDYPDSNPPLKLDYEDVVDLRTRSIRYEYDPWLDSSEYARLFQDKFTSSNYGSTNIQWQVNNAEAFKEEALFQQRLTAIFTHSFGKNYAKVVKRNPDNHTLTHEQVNHRLYEVIKSAIYAEQRVPRWVNSSVIGQRPAGLIYDNDHAVIVLNADLVNPMEEDLSKFYFEELGHMVNWWRCKAFDVDVSYCSTHGDGGARFRDAVLLDPSAHPEEPYETLLSQLPAHAEVDKTLIKFRGNKVATLEGWPNYYTMNNHIAAKGKFNWLMRLGLDIASEYPMVSDEFDMEVSITAPQLAKKGDPWTKVTTCQPPYQGDNVTIEHLDSPSAAETQVSPVYDNATIEHLDLPSNKLCICEKDTQTACNMPTMWVTISLRDVIKMSIAKAPKVTNTKFAKSGADISPRLVRKHGGKLPFQLNSVDSIKWDYYGDHNIYYKKFTTALEAKLDLWKMGHAIKGVEPSAVHKPEFSLKTTPAEGSYLVEIATKDTADFAAWLAGDIASAVVGCAAGFALGILVEEDPVLFCHGFSDLAEILETAFQGLDKRPTMLFEADGNVTLPVSLEYKYAKAKPKKPTQSVSTISGSRVKHDLRPAGINLNETHPSGRVTYNKATQRVTLNAREYPNAPRWSHPQVSDFKTKMKSNLKKGLRKLGSRSLSPVAVFSFRVGFDYSETIMNKGAYNLPSAIVSD